MQSTPETRALAQQILDQITERPESHNQNHYIEHNSCGTTRCIAGWAAFFGESILTRDDIWNRPDLAGKYEGVDGQMLDYPGIFHIGMGLLGLTDKEAYDIFIDLDDVSATQKLKHIVVGEDWIHGN